MTGYARFIEVSYILQFEGETKMSTQKVVLTVSENQTTHLTNLC